MVLSKEEGKLIVGLGTQTLWIEAWGENSLRVRFFDGAFCDQNDWALIETPVKTETEISITEREFCHGWYRTPEEIAANTEILKEASITNGKITAKVNYEGWLSFYNDEGEELLAESWRNRNRLERYCVPTKIRGRELKPIPGTSDYKLMVNFEAYEDERIYGMGQYQDPLLNRKGAVLELAQRNSQMTVPFLISSRGYGFLWNNPAIGTATFGTNKTVWTAESTKKMDYFITVGDTPAQLLKQYTDVTGRAPMMPEYGMGFWQCKLRYRNQEELLAVAREHKRRGLPMDVIVIDFFHWTKQGDFKFDPKDWPDPEAMIAELESMGIKLMVSVWPTVDSTSENFPAMNEQGYLVTCDRGVPIHMNWMGETVFFDATHPGSRQYVWDVCKKNYYDKGVRIFWLDEAEPEYDPYDYDTYRYYAGSALQCSNIYPAMYAKAFYDGMTAEGQENVLNLLRCCWAGSQRYGALAWSGDIYSSFQALQVQLQIGLNMGIAGIPWWTTDIGGFLGGDIHDADFRELLVRWFEWGAFCPVFRLHGERQPFYPLEEEFRNGTKMFSSGQDNEVWSFGEENYEILKKYLFLREAMRPYVRGLMEATHQTGEPVMRPMFFDFPEDKVCWELEATQYMFGPELLVAPVIEAKATTKTLYLPQGMKWVDVRNGNCYEGGQMITVDAPLAEIPVFAKEGSDVLRYFA